jgi:vacuolar iron transporter family protein
MHRHTERHRSHVVGWLRAAVLGANDGLVSTSSLLIGMSAAGTQAQTLLVAGLAALASGAMAMAAGEYVSVQSQADTEAADLARERAEIAADPLSEQNELAAIYVDRGLSPELAQTVAGQLMAHDPLGAHARDELGLSDTLAARPLQAAVFSAMSFAAGSLLPIAVVTVVSAKILIPTLGAVTVAALGVLGAVAAHAGGANRWRAAARVCVWGVFAMVVTAVVGKLFAVPLA